jgi:cardiolipin synthase
VRVLNRRNHRKVIVIDEGIAFFGGMNLIDPSRIAGLPSTANRPASAGWRDVHVRLSGSQQAEIAESFNRSWRRAHRQKVARRPPDYRLALLSDQPESIQFFDTGPGLRYTRAARVFVRLIRQARRTITLSMAYFIPVGRVLRELLRARRRGVRVQVILPGEYDVKLAQWAAHSLYALLLRRRIAIHESSAEMLHSKIMVVDQEWTVVGSCNLDSRSLFTNLEFLAVIRSRALSRTMQEVCRYEMERGRRVTLHDCYQRNCRQRLLNRLAWSLRWWL